MRRGLILFWLFLACLLGWLASCDIGDLTALRERGQETQATVTDKHESHGRSTTYTLYFTYTVRHSILYDNVLYDNDNVSSDLYERMNPGDRMIVTYLPERPETHRVGHVTSERVRECTVAWGIALLVTLGLPGLLIVAIEHDFQKELRLLRDGVAVPGVIRAVVPPPPDTKTTSYKVRYAFPLLQGEQTGENGVTPETAWRWEEGSTATVLYTPDSPAASRLYQALEYVQIRKRE